MRGTFVAGMSACLNLKIPVEVEFKTGGDFDSVCEIRIRGNGFTIEGLRLEGKGEPKSITLHRLCVEKLLLAGVLLPVEVNGAIGLFSIEQEKPPPLVAWTRLDLREPDTPAIVEGGDQ